MPGQAGHENALIFTVSAAFHLIIAENALELHSIRCFCTFTLQFPAFFRKFPENP